MVVTTLKSVSVGDIYTVDAVSFCAILSRVTCTDPSRDRGERRQLPDTGRWAPDEQRRVWSIAILACERDVSRSIDIFRWAVLWMILPSCVSLLFFCVIKCRLFVCVLISGATRVERTVGGGRRRDDACGAKRTHDVTCATVVAKPRTVRIFVV